MDIPHFHCKDTGRMAGGHLSYHISAGGLAPGGTSAYLDRGYSLCAAATGQNRLFACWARDVYFSTTGMFYVTSACPICLTGIIGFCRCGDNVSLALLCKDCNSMWDSPDHLDAAHALFPPHAGVRADGACRWASQSEIELRGWFELIFGELVSEPRDI